MSKRKAFAAAILLVITIAFAGRASAALLGVQPGLPQISFDISSTPPPYATTFDPATGILQVSAAPVSYRWSTTLRPASIAAPKSLAIRVHLDGNGNLLPGVAGDGVVITGNFSANGQTYSGTLLTGTVTGFGFSYSGATNSFDFRFTTTGGSLAANYPGRDIGITLASENSTFTGSFASAFQGNAKGTVGTIPGPYMTLTQTCTDATGQQPIQFSATLSNTGSESLTNVACSGAPEASLTGVPVTLAVGASAVITGSYLPTATPSTGTLTCNASGATSLVTIRSSASATCNVVATPALSVNQYCGDAPAPGQAITVSGTVTNTGNESLTGLTCSDSKGAVLSGIPSALLPGASAQFTGSYVPSASGSTDSVACSARGALDNITVNAVSSSTCNIKTAPAFTVSETCANAPQPGQPITLSALITNSGNETLGGFTCTDSKGAVLNGIPATLAPGATATVTGNYLPTGSNSTDTISCSATGTINGATVTASSSSTCNIVTAPAFTLAESCANAPSPGQPITLSALITNSGNEPLGGFTCTDSKGAVLNGIPATLAPGATAAVTGNYLPTGSNSTDTISCSATGTINGATVTASSSSTCNIVTAPALTLAESCVNAPAPGEPIALSALLTNSGNETLNGFSCSDSKGASLSGVPTTLAPGASATLTGSYVPTANNSSDTITCSATGAINSTAVSGSSSSTCGIVTRPALSVSESCTNAAAPGLPIGISATVTNTGNETLSGLTCTDSQGGSLTGVPATLSPGATAQIGGSYTPTTSPSTDSVSCRANGAISGTAVNGGSSATCSVFHPAISIKKLTNGVDAPTGTGPNLTVGSPVTWTYLVTNTGDVALQNVSVADDKVAGVSCPAATLAVAASMTCTATGTATAGQYQNTGTATGSAGGVSVTSSYISHYFGTSASGCTYTQGFWKTHPESWPLSSLYLGRISYTEEQLLNILNTPVRGNGLISLAHQLIAAKLNLRYGAGVTIEVQSAINAADLLIGSLTVPPVGSGYLATGDTSALEATLDGFNNGVSPYGPPHCSDAPTVSCSGSIGDFVWKDLNANGIQDASEPGLAGATVTLTALLNGAKQTAVTDVNGHYLFSGLCAGNYTVSVATPAGMTVSPVAAGSDREKDSSASPAQVALPTNSYAETGVDFGFYANSCTGSIGDFVWNDSNANGIQDAGEPGIAGVLLTLKNNTTGAVVATTTTDLNGLYRFNALCSGNYTVTVAAPAGYTASPALQGKDRTKDSNAASSTVSLGTNGSSDASIDFGFYRTTVCTGTVGNFVWNDLNLNGLQDPGEPGLSGVKVTLTNNGTGATTVTTSDAGGNYLFSGLCAGSYTVAVTTPAGFTPSPTGQGGNQSLDSNGVSTLTLSTNGSSNITIDFGFYNSSTPAQGNGCTIGYWKNHTSNWPSGYRSTDSFDTVFGTSAYSPDISLLQALQRGGGGLSDLARQGVAALLNAQDPRIVGYPLTPSAVKAAVFNAIASGNYESVATQLDSYNNLGCPLN